MLELPVRPTTAVVSALSGRHSHDHHAALHGGDETRATHACCCYSETYGMVTTSACVGRGGELCIAARRVGGAGAEEEELRKRRTSDGANVSGEGHTDAVDVALGDGMRVLAMRLIAGGALLVMLVRAPSGGGTAVEAVVVDLWRKDTSGGDGGRVGGRAGGTSGSCSVYRRSLHAHIQADMDSWHLVEVEGRADATIGPLFVVASARSSAEQQNRKQPSLLVCSAAWVQRTDPGIPYELQTAPTLKDSISSMVSWPLQWLDAAALSSASGARAGGAAAGTALAAAALRGRGTYDTGSGVVAYSSATCGAALRVWQVFVGTGTSDALHADVPLFDANQFNAERDVVTLLHVADGGDYAAAAVRTHSTDATNDYCYRIHGWKLVYEKHGSVRAEHSFMSPPLNNTQEVAQLVSAADGRVLWVSYGREEGGGSGGSGLGVGVGLGGVKSVAPAVYSYVPQEGGEAERVFTLDMGVAMELPGCSGRDDRADVNRAAFIAEWMHDGERRLGCGSGNKTARAKALMASALARRMMGSQACWCALSAAKALERDDPESISSYEALTDALLQYADRRLGRSGSESTSDVLLVFAHLCSAYHTELLRTMSPTLLFSVAGGATSGGACALSGLIRGRDGVCIFSQSKHGLGCSMDVKMSALLNASWNAVAPSGTMTRLAIEAAQTQNMALVNALLKEVMSAGVLGEDMVSVNSNDWLSHATEKRSLIATFFEALHHSQDGLTAAVRQAVATLESLLFGQVGEVASTTLPHYGGRDSPTCASAATSVSYLVGHCASALNDASLSMMLLVPVLVRVADAVNLSMLDVFDLRNDILSRATHLAAASFALKLVGTRPKYACDDIQITATPSTADHASQLSGLSLHSTQFSPAVAASILTQQPSILQLLIEDRALRTATGISPANLALESLPISAAPAVRDLMWGIFPAAKGVRAAMDVSVSLVEFGSTLLQHGYFHEVDDVMKILSEGLPECRCRYAMAFLRGLSAIAQKANSRAASVSDGSGDNSDDDSLERVACSYFIEASSGVGEEQELDALLRGFSSRLTGLDGDDAMATLGPVSRVQYFEVVMMMFERYNCLYGACELGVAALREIANAIAIGDSGMQDADVAESFAVQHTRISHNVFKYYCDKRQYLDAFQILRGISPENGQLTCLQRLVVLMTEAGAVQELVGIPFASLTRNVEVTLQERALVSPIAVAPKVYETLFVYHTSRSQHHSAAKFMTEFACRLGSETGIPGSRALNGKTMEDESEIGNVLSAMKLAYLAAVNSLRLLEDGDAWVAVSFDETNDLDYSCFRGRGTASSPGSGDAAHGKAFQSKEDALFQQGSLGVVGRLLLLDDGDATMDAIRSLSGGSAAPADRTQRAHVLSISDIRLRLAVTSARLEVHRLTPGQAKRHTQKHGLSSIYDILIVLMDAKLYAPALELGLRLSDHAGSCHEALEIALRGIARCCCDVNASERVQASAMSGLGGVDDVDMRDATNGVFSRNATSWSSSLARLSREMDELSDFPGAAALDAVLGGVGIIELSSSWDGLRVTLERVFTKYRRPQLWNLVASTILGFDRRMRLPAWLTSMGTKLDWVGVVRLFMEHDLICEAADVVIEQFRVWRSGPLNNTASSAFFPYKLIGNLQSRLGAVAASARAAPPADEYSLRCAGMKQEFDMEVERHIQTMEKYDHLVTQTASRAF